MQNLDTGIGDARKRRFRFDLDFGDRRAAYLSPRVAGQRLPRRIASSSAMLTKSASDSASIFRMTLARCDFNGRFGDGQFIADLFIEEALNNAEEYLLLTRSERVVTRPHLCPRRPFLSGGGIAANGGLNGIQEILIPERFRQEVNGARGHGVDRHLDIAVPCDANDRNPNIGAKELTLQIQPAGAGQTNIEDEATRFHRDVLHPETPGRWRTFERQARSSGGDF
jgi:hypothetical protein